MSARTRYERFYPGQPLCWKAAAFAHEVNEIYEDDIDDDDDIQAPANVSCDSMESTDVSSESDDSGDLHRRHHGDRYRESSLHRTSDGVTTSSSSSSSSRKVGGTQKSTGATTTNRFQDNKREIISFGDSMEERTAVRIVSGQLSALPKSVTFISTPSPLQLIGQLSMLTSHMGFVCDHASSLDLEISPVQAQRCAESYMERTKAMGVVPVDNDDTSNNHNNNAAATSGNTDTFLSRTRRPATTVVGGPDGAMDMHGE